MLAERFYQFGDEGAGHRSRRPRVRDMRGETMRVGSTGRSRVAASLHSRIQPAPEAGSVIKTDCCIKLFVGNRRAGSSVASKNDGSR